MKLAANNNFCNMSGGWYSPSQELNPNGKNQSGPMCPSKGIYSGIFYTRKQFQAILNFNIATNHIAYIDIVEDFKFLKLSKHSNCFLTLVFSSHFGEYNSFDMIKKYP